MQRRSRAMFVAIFAGLLTIVVSAGITWACTVDQFGTPTTPTSAPDPSTPAPPPPTAPAVGAAPAPAPTPSAEPRGVAEVNGARSAPRANAKVGARGNNEAPARRNSGVGVAPPNVTTTPGAYGGARTQFAERARGGTTGVTTRGGRAVFGTPGEKAKSSRAADKGARSAPSSRSAGGDLWEGFEPQARSSVLTAEASADEEVAGDGAIGVAKFALGFGLAGAVASATVLGFRRRHRAEAPAVEDSDDTEPPEAQPSSTSQTTD